VGPLLSKIETMEDKEFLERSRQMFWLLEFVLPISQAEKQGFKILGELPQEVIPSLLSASMQLCVKYPEPFAGYLVFLKQACDYIMGNSDQWPDTDGDPGELIRYYSIQTGQWREQKEKQKLIVRDKFVTFNDQEY